MADRIRGLKRHITLMPLLNFISLYLVCFFAALFETLDSLRGTYCQFTPFFRISLACLQPELKRNEHHHVEPTRNTFTIIVNFT